MITLRQLRQTKSRELPNIASLVYSIQLLLKHQGVILSRDSQPVGSITRHNVINYMDLQ